MSSKVVYFVGAANGHGHIKVGCSINPLKRMRQVQMSSPVELAMLAAIGGNADIEHRFHYRYRDHHAWGEWFERHDLLIADMQHINGCTFRPEWLEPCHEIIKSSVDGWFQPKHEAYLLRLQDEALSKSAYEQSAEFGDDWRDYSDTSKGPWVPKRFRVGG